MLETCHFIFYGHKDLIVTLLVQICTFYIQIYINTFILYSSRKINYVARFLSCINCYVNILCSLRPHLELHVSFGFDVVKWIFSFHCIIWNDLTCNMKVSSSNKNPCALFSELYEKNLLHYDQLVYSTQFIIYRLSHRYFILQTTNKYFT